MHLIPQLRAVTFNKSIDWDMQERYIPLSTFSLSQIPINVIQSCSVCRILWGQRSWECKGREKHHLGTQVPHTHTEMITVTRKGMSTLWQELKCFLKMVLNLVLHKVQDLDGKELKVQRDRSLEAVFGEWQIIRLELKVEFNKRQWE